MYLFQESLGVLYPLGEEIAKINDKNNFCTTEGSAHQKILLFYWVLQAAYQKDGNHIIKLKRNLIGWQYIILRSAVKRYVLEPI